MIEGWPLYWPEHWARTRQRRTAPFKMTPAKARRELIWELQRLGARHIIISTNVPLRRDGQPFADGKPTNGDPAVAVWFELDGEQQCIPCDRWSKVGDNIRAIGKSVEAIRGLERWGAQSMVKAAFKGFAALPPPGVTNWRDVLGRDVLTSEQVDRRYRELARERHPDTGGSDAMMADLNAARDAARKEMGGG
jgi:hypothetical protein